ncbi:ATP-binding cassette domain-containing protein [Agromyces aerolatus]|uniref:ATP-binding cassette domain-containing protein n=1 Tax=Agromyces sp. LY-1074 TaxID=3074080 RepID=UPI0028631AFA|nr:MULTISPECIES: ATP-binding cassette domain-containing protein [unclassified Agromyces]MDR5699032.1 ATP-binding cassette domain-containing protein [Agromyces sp. LY-1074]MDR5705190.1 ATP-binding cassette domain-containing protein [Agromyces sp. LY-1358]
MTLLRVTDVTKQFPGSERRAVDAVSFDLDAGATLGVVGESGSGKSTLARCVAGLIDPDRGSVTLNGTEIVGASSATKRRIRRDVQMVFQDPFASLSPRMTVEELVGEGLLVHGIERNASRRRARVVEILEQVGLGAVDLKRYPRSFSGGQRQRIAIARAMAVGPQLLICDEPVSSLDVSVQAQVLNLLKDLQRDLGLSLLFIAHDLAVVRHLCERVVVMHHGVAVESGTREEIFERPKDPYTRSLLDAVPIPDPVVERARRQHLLEVGAGSPVPTVRAAS